MKLNSISSAGIYANNAVAMKARKSSDAILRDFKEFMKNQNLVLNATITPNGKDFYYEIELSKKRGYELTPVTDADGYGVNASGRTLNEAILDMAKNYGGRELYNLSVMATLQAPKYV